MLIIHYIPYCINVKFGSEYNFINMMPLHILIILITVWLMLHEIGERRVDGFVAIFVAIARLLQGMVARLEWNVIA